MDTQPRKLAICCTQNPGDCQSLGPQNQSQGKHPVDQLAARYGGSQPGISHSRPCLHGIVLLVSTVLCVTFLAPIEGGTEEAKQEAMTTG